MEIKIKVIDRISTTFYLTFNSSTSIKEVKEKICNKLKKNPETITLRRGNEILNDKLDLDSYEFGSYGVIEISFI